MDSFIFYRSFMDAVEYFEGGEQKDCLFYAVKCLLGDMDPRDVPFPYGAVIIQMKASVQAAKDRHDKAKGDGAKGGRPKYIQPAEWQEYLKNHTQKETADHFGISVDTLQRWQKKTAKPQNLNDNVNVNDNGNVNVNANDNDNDINSIYINNNGSVDAHALSGIVLPVLKEGERWVTEPYVRPDGKVMADYKDASGEVRSMFIG